MIRPILTYPHPCLTTVCAEVEDPALAKEIEQDLWDSMTPHAQGLAAPQIGYPFRIFVLKSWPNAFVNPTLEFSDELTDSKEGCLSLPGERFIVCRSKKVKVIYSITDLDFETRMRAKMRGIDARAAQHELDHLNGVLLNSKERRVV